MLPLLIVSSEQSKTQKYIIDLLQQQAVDRFNIHTISLLPKKKEIAVHQIREINTLFRTHIGGKLAILIEAFETAGEEAQNALLKTLEEKTGQALFFLQVTNVHAVLPTIRSRCTLVDLQEPGTVTPKEIAADIFKVISASAYNALSHKEVTGISAEKAAALCEEFIHVLRIKLRTGSPVAARLIKETIRTRQLILSNNLNSQLAIDALVLTYSASIHYNK